MGATQAIQSHITPSSPKENEPFSEHPTYFEQLWNPIEAQMTQVLNQTGYPYALKAVIQDTKFVFNEAFQILLRTNQRYNANPNQENKEKHTKAFRNFSQLQADLASFAQ